MIVQTNLKKIEDNQKSNIQKTMNHPIKDALKGSEIKDTIFSQEKKLNVLSPNQISVTLDKYENRVIKKKKIKIT